MRAADLVVDYPTVSLSSLAFAAARLLEVVALMAHTRSPVVTVADSVVLPGAVTLDRLLDRILAS